MTLRLLRLAAVIDRIGLGPTSIYGRAQRELFTPPVKLTARSSAWPEHEVDAIAAAMIRGDDEDAIRALVRGLVAARAALPQQRAP